MILRGCKLVALGTQEKINYSLLSQHYKSNEKEENLPIKEMNGQRKAICQVEHIGWAFDTSRRQV